MAAETTSGPPAAMAWEILSPRRFAFLLGILLVAAYPEVIFGGKTFFYRDFSIFGYPLAHYHRECFWRGEIPLWNPLNNCGVPFLAQWNAMTLYPLSLFYLLLPLSWSLGVFCIGHLFLGGFGVYRLALRWTNHRLAASIAGVAFAFNGFSTYALVWPPIVAALAWMPWVVMTTEQAWRGGGKQVIVAALAGAMQMLTGGVEVILFTWAILGAQLFGESFRNTAARGFGLKHAWLRFAGVALLITGLSAMQLLPFLDLLAHSQRDAGFSDSDWPMPLSGFANLLVPLFHTYRSFHGVFMQYGQQWVGSFYLGAGVVALALLALWRPRESRIWLLAAVVGLSLLLALGEQSPVYPAVRKLLPQLSLMRFPVKFLIPVVFILPLLAAFSIGTRNEVIIDSDRASHHLRRLLLVTVALTVLIGLTLWAARTRPMPKDDWAMTLRNALERLSLLWLFVAGLMGLRAARHPKAQAAIGITLLGLLWIDLRTHAPNQAPTVDRQVYDSALGRAQWTNEIAPAHGTSRAFVSPEAQARLRHSSVATPEDETLGRRLALFGNLNLLDDVPKVNGFFALYPRETTEWLSLLYPKPAANLDRFLDFLNVSHVTAPGTLMEWSPRPAPMPFATAGQRPIFADSVQALSGVASPEFDPAEMVLLPSDAKDRVPVHSRSKAQITSRRVSAHRVELEVDAADPSIVVLAQSFYHAWKARVDSQPAEIWQANLGFQAIAVPAGRHRLVLAYEDKAFRLGVLVSCLSLVLCGVIWFGLRRRPQLQIAESGRNRA